MKPPEPYRECWCRDPVTNRPLGRSCPQLGQKGHGAWYANTRHRAPLTVGADARGSARTRPRRPPAKPWPTRSAGSRQGAHVDDRRTTFGEYLTRRLGWWESEAEIKPSTLASYREAIELYFRPGLGHVRLVDLRDQDFRDLYAAMRLINRPEAGRPQRDAPQADRGARRAHARPARIHPAADRSRGSSGCTQSRRAPQRRVPQTLPATRPRR